MCSHKPNFVCNPEEFTCLACGDSFQLESEVVHHVTQHDWTAVSNVSFIEIKRTLIARVGCMSDLPQFLID